MTGQTFTFLYQMDKIHVRQETAHKTDTFHGINLKCSVPLGNLGKRCDVRKGFVEDVWETGDCRLIKEGFFNLQSAAQFSILENPAILFLQC